MRSGSPPRGWGKRQGLGPNVHRPRFTPTRVGKTRASSVAVSVFFGSPPRGWGKRLYVRRRRRAVRFTPTRVGKTRCVNPIREGQTVHPHAGGENSRFLHVQAATAGSPPRGWGKLAIVAVWQDAVRFTPTRVGKTWSPALRRGWYPVHPHAGGENASSCTSTQTAWRFTPTRVGKTSSCRNKFLRYSVHPHAGGENVCRLSLSLAASVHPHAGGENGLSMFPRRPVIGSPPRGWGKRRHRRLAQRRERFTPTRVGKTKCQTVTSAGKTVHPHAGGENCWWPLPDNGISGSPPRGWGKRHYVLDKPLVGRFTPTRVGKTRWLRSAS